MQTQTWKLVRLALPLVLALTVTGNPSRADEGAPGIVRMERIGADQLEPTSIATPPAVITGSGDSLDSCLGPPPVPHGMPAPCAGPCQPRAKKRGCCLFRCCSDDDECDDDYDECESHCGQARKRGCCLFGCGSRDDDCECESRCGPARKRGCCLLGCCLLGCGSRDDDCEDCRRGSCCGKSGKGCCLWPWRCGRGCAANGHGECDNGGCGCCAWLTGGRLGPTHGGAGGAYGYPYGSAAAMRLAHLRCKLGYFIPTGDCGNGLPWAGHYKLVYPLNPDFHDPRDSRVYAAQGYGVPVAVPLAPNVDFTYNYGWGVPSSRLTPVSRHVPGTNPILWPIPPGQRY